MINFNFQNATKIIFGKETENTIGTEIKPNSNNILLHYGSSSIKKSGLYEKIIISLKENNINYTELSGVVPNPRLSLVQKGIEICRENKIDFILAVGGGSVIDSAKAIAAGFYYEGNVWDLFLGKAMAEKCLPIGVVLTIPAAGSESSTASVITNEDGWVKVGYRDINLRPVFAIMNPELTFTLPANQTSNGISDMIAHIMERYFTDVTAVDLTDRLCEATIKSIIYNAGKIIDNPNDYDSRAEIMLAGTIAHNDVLGLGRIGDWASHGIEHELSAIYDIPHGAGLSIIFPAWMKYVYKQDINRFVQFATRVFDIPNLATPEETALAGIKSMENFYKSINLPIRLSELHISNEHFEEMASKAIRFGDVGNFVKLKKQDIINIYNLAL